ncbi:MAG: signal peptidase II [Clostridia bacterium]|nr:signal peptidase II [Clostridia bacterium]
MSKKKLAKKVKVYSLKGSAWWGIFLFFVLVFIDQATKFVAEAYFTRPGAREEVPLIDGWISFCLHYNDGIAFSWLQDAGAWVKIAVVVGTAVLMALFAVFYFRLDKRRTWLRWALVFVIAGGVGNLIDRVYFQVWDTASLYGVRDMVDLSRFGFGICNFADFFISGGAVALVLALLFFDRDALFPVGKYKTMAKEYELAENAKEKKVEYDG